jgi:hypothetical protein
VVIRTREARVSLRRCADRFARVRGRPRRRDGGKFGGSALDRGSRRERDERDGDGDGAGDADDVRVSA